MRPSPLTRRQALRAAGSSIGLPVVGCATQSDREVAPPTTTEPTDQAAPAEPTTGTPTPDFARVTADDLSLRVDLRRQFTADHPARVEATLENTSERPVTASGGPTFPFGFSRGEHGQRDATLLAIPFDNSHLHTDPSADRLVPRAPTDGCWSVDYDLRSELRGLIGVLAPGEVHRLRYAILDYDNDACRPPGAYRFAYSLGVTPGGNRQRARYDPVAVTLSFELLVARDRTVSVEATEPELDR